VNSNIKCPPKIGRRGKEKSPMEEVLVLVLHPINIDTEIPWDVHCLLWNGTVREAISPGTSGLRCGITMQGVTATRSYEVRSCEANSFKKSAKTINRELGRGMVAHVLLDILFVRTECNRTVDNALFCSSLLFFGAGDQ
jgi:hypothetical protein